MAMTIKQARGMLPGNRLTFGDNPAIFEVVEVQARGAGVYLVLRRDDGFETFATEHDLDVASLVNATPAENPLLDEIAALKQQLEAAQAPKPEDQPNNEGGEPTVENPQIDTPIPADSESNVDNAAGGHESMTGNSEPTSDPIQSVTTQKGKGKK